MTIKSFRGEYRFLSNFCLCKVKYGRKTYDSTEHAFQAAKTKSSIEREWVQSEPTPGKAKAMGRNVTLRKDWDTYKGELKVKDWVMLKLLRRKYKQKEFKKLLLATGKQKLIEENTWHDNYWGNCICYECKNIKGKNRLGKLTILVRSELC